MEVRELNTFQIIEEAKHVYVLATRFDMLSDLDERPDYHPEPNAFVHTMIVMSRLIQANAGNDLILAGLLHDICKADVAKINPNSGFPMCPGHAEVGADFIERNETITNFIKAKGGDVERVINLVRFHNQFYQLKDMRPTKQKVRTDLWKQLGIWEDLHTFEAADNMVKDFDLTFYKRHTNDK